VEIEIRNYSFGVLTNGMLLRLTSLSFTAWLSCRGNSRRVLEYELFEALMVWYVATEAGVHGLRREWEERRCVPI
jgi:hypothetical protein